MNSQSERKLGSQENRANRCAASYYNLGFVRRLVPRLLAVEDMFGILGGNDGGGVA